MQLCRSCGDDVHSVSADFEEVAPRDRYLWSTYCDECAREKADGEIPPLETLQYGTGGGIRVIRGTRAFGG